MATFRIASRLLFLALWRLIHASIPPPEPQTLWPRVANITSTSTGSRTSTAVATTAVPTYSCYYHGISPHLGTPSPWCVCRYDPTSSSDVVDEWPLMTIPNFSLTRYTQSCDYTERPISEGTCMNIGNTNPHGGSNQESPTSKSESHYLQSSISSTTSTSRRALSDALSNITAAPLHVSSCPTPSNQSSEFNAECRLTDAYCSLRDPNHALDGLRHECILWDPTCCGNSTFASNKFSDDHIRQIITNSCFGDSPTICTERNPPDRMSAFSELRHWMRSPERYSAIFPDIQRYADPGIYEADLYLNQTCCGNCELAADRVDVYYWPDPDADRSCLSIVGNSVSDIRAGGTTKGKGSIYWGCTSTGTRLGIMNTDTVTTFKTATLTAIASLTFKTYLMNPWDGTPCDNNSSSSNSSLSLKSKYMPRSLLPRVHSILVTENAVSTTTVDGFTLTSPSVYLNFVNLHGSDSCGDPNLPTTMIGFAPGEISTIRGRVEYRFQPSQQFDPNDLPCPPQRVMSENWYTPIPGVPYRPFFAFPNKVRQLIPSLAHCNAFWFSVFDPPRTLGPATAMVADVTTTDSIQPTIAPMPSPTMPHPLEPTKPPGLPQSLPGIPPADPGAKGSIDPPKETGLVLHGDETASSAMSVAVPPGQDSMGAGSDPQTHGNVGVSSDPAGQDSAKADSNNAGLRGEHPSPTTYQLGPQSGSGPTTIKIGRIPEGEHNVAELATSMIREPGHLLPGEGSRSGPDPNSPVKNVPSPFLLVTAAGQVITISDPSAVPIAGTTLTPGGPEAITAGTPVSLASDANLVVGNGALPPTSTIVTIAGQVFTANPISFNIDGSRVVAGQPSVTVSGTPISLGSSGNLVVGGKSGDTLLEPPTFFNAGDHMFTADQGGFNVAGVTVAVGSPAVLVQGTPISLDSSGLLIIGSSTAILAARVTPPAISAIDGQTVAPNLVGLKADTPISPGHSDAQVSTGTPAIGIHPVEPSIFIVGGQTITANPSALAIAGETFSAGASGTTIDGTILSLNPSGSLIIGTSTIPLQTPTISAPSIITTDGYVFTIGSNGALAVNGTTLTSGGSGTTVNGVPMRMGSKGLIVGSDTISLPASATSNAPALTQSPPATDSAAASISSLTAPDPAQPTSSQKGAAPPGMDIPNLTAWYGVLIAMATVYL